MEIAQENVSAIRAGFDSQTVMKTFGASIADLRPGAAVLHLPYREELTQQHGFIHAGVVSAVLDSACGCATLSRLPAGSSVLTIEFKVNLLAPAAGDLLIATARVLRAGRSIVVCEATAEMRDGSGQRPTAHMTATLMSRPPAG